MRVLCNEEYQKVLSRDLPPRCILSAVLERVQGFSSARYSKCVLPAKEKDFPAVFNEGCEQLVHALYCMHCGLSIQQICLDTGVALCICTGHDTLAPACHRHQCMRKWRGGCQQAQSTYRPAPVVPKQGRLKWCSTPGTAVWCMHSSKQNTAQTLAVPAVTITAEMRTAVACCRKDLHLCSSIRTAN